MSKIIIGLTGGIGSGKTATSDYFQKLGIDIIDADIVARKIVQPPSPALQQIAEHFGHNAINIDGTLNRSYMRQIVFADADKKQLLETITHPLIREDIQGQLDIAKSPYCILVSPLLFEMGQQQLCTRTVLIDCSEQQQISRASDRDNNTEDSIQRIIDAQMSRHQRRTLADDIVLNDRLLDDLYRQLDELHEQYLQLGYQANVRKPDTQGRVRG